MTTKAANTGQVSKSAAEIYDEFFVPALFGAWAEPLCDAVIIKPGQAVLDVACGTGATTRVAASRIGREDPIVGLDRNSDMLAVARNRAPGIEWVEGVAEELPFADGGFDTVLCQFGLMFFEDKAQALRQMRRVLRPGGRIALSVWDHEANTPGYAGMIALIDEMFGFDAADALRAPFILGDTERLRGLLGEGGMADAALSTVSGTARFDSIHEWVRMDVRGWTLAEFIDDAGFVALIKAAEDRLDQFAGANGKVEFPAPAHIVVWECR
ncbi:class I SAM-dependent methyltransferase [Tropicimonas sp. IMCC6043]|uniref:class I SAM-dependent methyltransferase n=1 Tax=Tropicimonas sp. IMCC6043 TaxID=2510645 RepID=UPI00101B8AB4|nr:methyltransferase domain-containing protein [Tropicimonas sp. IMCC6043]RYH05848.1 methyltransferase domain-containing protein [Tropicimonas sp. IMCC6043]